MLLIPKEVTLQGAGMLSVSLKFKFSSTQITIMWSSKLYILSNPVSSCIINTYLIHGFSVYFGKAFQRFKLTWECMWMCGITLVREQASFLPYPVPKRSKLVGNRKKDTNSILHPLLIFPSPFLLSSFLFLTPNLLKLSHSSHCSIGLGCEAGFRVGKSREASVLKIQLNSNASLDES